MVRPSTIWSKRTSLIFALISSKWTPTAPGYSATLRSSTPPALAARLGHLLKTRNGHDHARNTQFFSLYRWPHRGRCASSSSPVARYQGLAHLQF
ncbi:MAG: hypothetical protein Q7W38_05575 [Deltaproteobacteria bacterium]|nr:hypothetical protein [Deltaproteobacteria bacterium]